MGFIRVRCDTAFRFVQQPLSGSPYPTGCDCVYFGGDASVMVDHKIGAGVGKESAIGRGSGRSNFCDGFIADDLCFL